jgi:hypothetical protein
MLLKMEEDLPKDVLIKKYMPGFLKVLKSSLYSIPNSRIKKQLKYDMILLYKDFKECKDINKSLDTVLKTIKPAIEIIGNDYKKENLANTAIFLNQLKTTK